MNTMVKGVDDNLENYRIPEAARVLEDFVDDMSNWYVRRCRDRYWAKGLEQDKINAYMTLYTALVTVAKASAPMIPFMAEQIYQNLVKSVDANAPESIHLCDFPEVNEDWIDAELESKMEEVLKIVVMGRAARNAANIKNRQPISDIYVMAEEKLDSFYTDIVKDELNVKSVEFRDSVEEFITYTFKPQLKTVGPKYGKHLGQIKEALANVDGQAAMKELNDNGALKFNFGGDDVELTRDDLLIDTGKSDDFVSESDAKVTVVLNIKLTPELIEEGFVREVISKIQTMRKDADFEVMDHIRFSLKGNDKLAEIIKKNEEMIKSDTLTNEVVYGEVSGSVKDWNINGEDVTFGVEVI